MRRPSPYLIDVLGPFESEEAEAVKAWVEKPTMPMTLQALADAVDDLLGTHGRCRTYWHDDKTHEIQLEWAGLSEDDARHMLILLKMAVERSQP